jgi:bacillithiol system protein YtxJ
MNWIPLQSMDQLAAIDEQSNTQPVFILKHSTRCSISVMALGRLERSTAPLHTSWYYLDLLNYREISNAIAERYSVHHESPQLLLIKNGECVYDESHQGIRMEEAVEQLA